MWEVKFKLGIFRQKPSFLSRGTFLSRATLHKKLSVGLLRSQKLLSLMRELFLGLLLILLWAQSQDWLKTARFSGLSWFQYSPLLTHNVKRGKKPQLPAATTWQQPQEMLCISPIICRSSLCMDSRWVLVHCWWAVPPAQVQPFYHQQLYDVREKHSKWVDPEEKCNWMWQLLHAQASLPQPWWVVTFTVTWKEENLKLAMLGIIDWVSCMRTRAPQSILASNLRCHFLRVAQFFFSVISKGCHL